MEPNSFWCIVGYLGITPFYYCGYYKSRVFDEPMKPVISGDFNKAMKLHTQEEAKRILAEMNIPNWVVEEHGWM